MNYYSGIGVLFLVLTHFYALSRKDLPSLARLFFHTLLVSLLFFWHLAPLVIYIVVMGARLLSQTCEHFREGKGLGRCILRGVILALPTVPARSALSCVPRCPR